MLTFGYGDITPKNQGEMWFNVWAMRFGTIIFGYSMNRIGEILKIMGGIDRNLK
jgi:rRNA processing protein Gar1